MAHVALFMPTSWHVRARGLGAASGADGAVGGRPGGLVGQLERAVGMGDRLDEAKALIVREWAMLHANGIVPQPVPLKMRHLAAEEGN